jgi:Bacterial DNA-binding protein
MLKSELILRLAEQNPLLYRTQVERVVDVLFGEIEAALTRAIGWSFGASGYSPSRRGRREVPGILKAAHW